MKIIKKFYFYFNNIFWLSLTLLLAPFFYCLIFLRKKNIKKPERILIIPPVKIGDLVCSTPIFREIKKAFPESYLGVLLLADSNRRITSSDLLKNNPYINKIILTKKRGTKIIGILGLIKEIYQQKYDWSFTLSTGVIEKIIPFWSAISHRAIIVSKYATRTSKILNFIGNYKSEIKLHTLALRHRLNLLKFINIKKFNEKKEIFVNKNEEKKVIQFLTKQDVNSNDFLIGIAVTAGNKLKEWPQKKFAQLADKLITELQAKIIFIGGPNDKEVISSVQSKMEYKSIDSSQYLNLIELAGLLKHLKLFISVDTGPIYMANAMETPVIDIAGPIDIYEQPPLGDKCEIVQKDLSCVPCSFVIKTARTCRHGHRKCVEDIKVDDVFKAVVKLIKRNQL